MRTSGQQSWGVGRSPPCRKANSEHEERVCQNRSNLEAATCSEFWASSIFQVASSKSVTFSLPFLTKILSTSLSLVSIHASIVGNARQSVHAEDTSQMVPSQVSTLTAACLQSSDSSPAPPQFASHCLRSFRFQIVINVADGLPPAVTAVRKEARATGSRRAHPQPKRTKVAITTTTIISNGY